MRISSFGLWFGISESWGSGLPFWLGVLSLYSAMREQKRGGQNHVTHSVVHSFYPWFFWHSEVAMGKHRRLRADLLRQSGGKVQCVKNREQGFINFIFVPEWSMVSPGQILVNKTWRGYRVGFGSQFWTQRHQSAKGSVCEVV